MLKQTDIQMVVFDWAGTTVDFGCFAPVKPFIDAFAEMGVTVTAEQVRGPMGLHKKDHIRCLLQLREVALQWRKAHDRDWDEADVETLYSDHFVPRQLQAVRQHAELIPGLLDAVAFLRKRQIKIVTTTGYFGEAARIVYEAAQEQGYKPDYNLCADDVPSGRPAPWMIFRHMEKLNVYPPSSVIKVGDTVHDIAEGLNAGAWSVGVAKTSAEVGLTEKEFHALTADQQKKRIGAARQKLLAAGAHHVIGSVSDLPQLLAEIE